MELQRFCKSNANTYPLHNRYNPLHLVPVTDAFLYSTRYVPVTTRYTLVDMVGINFLMADLPSLLLATARSGQTCACGPTNWTGECGPTH